MDRVLTNYGLSHIKDQIFEELDNSTLAACLLVCKDWYDALTRLKLRRYLVWLMTNSKINAYHSNFDYNFFKVTDSFLRIFPQWMNLSGHFKTQGSLDNISEVIRVLKLYLSEPDFRTDFESGKACPIYYAAEKGYLPILKILVPISVKLGLLDPFNDGPWSLEPAYSPFSLSCQFGHTESVQFFLELKKAKCCMTYLKTKIFGNEKESVFLACQNGHLDVVKLLLHHYKEELPDLVTLQSYNAQSMTTINQTIFHAACQSGNLELVLYLIHHCDQLALDLNHQDTKGETALHIACRNGHTDVVNVLLDCEMLGIFSCPENSSNETIFHVACEDKRGNLTTVKLLIERSKGIGLDLNKPNNCGWTAFHYACRNGDMEIVKLMVDNAEALFLNGLTTNNENILHIACDSGNLDVVKLLLDHPEIGFDINQRDADGNTPIYTACYTQYFQDSLNLVQFLFEHADVKGIDLLAKNNEDRTILHASTDDDDAIDTLKMIKLILEHANKIGLDVNHEDVEGNTALDLAREKLDIARGARFDHPNDFERLNRWREIVAFLESYI